MTDEKKEAPEHPEPTHVTVYVTFTRTQYGSSAPKVTGAFSSNPEYCKADKRVYRVRVPIPQDAFKEPTFPELGVSDVRKVAEPMPPRVFSFDD